MPLPKALQQIQAALAKQAENSLAKQQKLKVRDTMGSTPLQPKVQEPAPTPSQPKVQSPAPTPEIAPTTSLKTKVQSPAPTPEIAPTTSLKTKVQSPAPTPSQSKFQPPAPTPEIAPAIGGGGLKKGGKVSASSRGDGIAQRGKTKGRYI